MGKLLEHFKILCTDFDHIFEKKLGDYSRGNIIQERTLIKELSATTLQSYTGQNREQAGNLNTGKSSFH